MYVAPLWSGKNGLQNTFILNDIGTIHVYLFLTEKMDYQIPLSQSEEVLPHVNLFVKDINGLQNTFISIGRGTASF
jgi:hypothetical protein